VLVFQGVRAEGAEGAFSVVALGVLKAAAISGVLGYLSAVLFVRLRERDNIPDFLHNAVIVPFALAVYALANTVQAESGLLAVTIMGIALASQTKVDMEKSREFTEHARVLLISTLFILLTGRMEISDITGLPISVLGFLVVVVLVARPLSVWLSTARSGLSSREKVFLGATAPRGVVAAAVSSLFALELVEFGYPEASLLMPVTFAVITTTVLASGLLASPLVKRLGLGQVEPQGAVIVGAGEVGRTLAQALKRHGIKAILIDSDKTKVDEARRLGLIAKKGEVLSRRVLRELDLDGFGHFVALTPNDDVNTLAVAHFRRLFGKSRVHQVRPSTDLGRPLPEYAKDIQAPILAAGITLEKLEALTKAGGLIRDFDLDEIEDKDDIARAIHPDAAPLFAIKDGKLSFVHDDGLPAEGTLVALCPP
jgi:NhaP-type Na+/H+ and K+/H+ antiporter